MDVNKDAVFRRILGVSKDIGMIHKCLNDLQADIAKSRRKEINDISLGAIYNFTVPKLLETLSDNRIPNSLFYFNYH